MCFAAAVPKYGEPTPSYNALTWKPCRVRNIPRWIACSGNPESHYTEIHERSQEVIFFWIAWPDAPGGPSHQFQPAEVRHVLPN